MQCEAAETVACLLACPLSGFDQVIDVDEALSNPIPPDG